MATQTAKVIELARNSILSRAHALGNSSKGLKNVASDLLNREARGNPKALTRIAEGTFLCRQTLQRVMDCEENYRPQADTLERIFRYFGAEITFNEVAIKPRFQNKAKE